MITQIYFSIFSAFLQYLFIFCCFLISQNSVYLQRGIQKPLRVFLEFFKYTCLGIVWPDIFQGQVSRYVIPFPRQRVPLEYSRVTQEERGYPGSLKIENSSLKDQTNATMQIPHWYNLQFFMTQLIKFAKMRLLQFTYRTL